MVSLAKYKPGATIVLAQGKMRCIWGVPHFWDIELNDSGVSMNEPKDESRRGLIGNLGKPKQHAGEQNTPGPSMAYEKKSFLDHWYELSKEAGSKVPRRVQYSPDRVGDVLPHLALLERTVEGFFIRYLGTAVDVSGAGTLVNSSFFDNIPPQERSFFGGLFHAVMDMPCGVRIRRTIYFLNGSSLRLESLDVPTANDQDEIVFTMGLYDIQYRQHAHAPIEHIREGSEHTIGDILAAGISHTEYTRPIYVDLGYGVPKTVPEQPPSTQSVQIGMVPPVNNR